MQARATATHPDGRFPNLFVFQITPAQGHTVEENQRELEGVLRRFTAAPPDNFGFERAKAQARANLLRRMSSNREVAALLAAHAAGYGSWQKLFTVFDELNGLKPQDVVRAASRCFVPAGRTTVYSALPVRYDISPPPGAAEPGAGGPQ